MYNKLMSPQTTLEIDAFAINPIGPVDMEGKPMSLFKMVPAIVRDLLEEELEFGGATEEKEPWLVNFDEIRMDKLIGTGSFGDVYAASWSSKKVAAKKFIRQKITSQLVLEIRTECAILRYGGNTKR
jgi:hypothetical protein